MPATTTQAWVAQQHTVCTAPVPSIRVRALWGAGATAAARPLAAATRPRRRRLGSPPVYAWAFFKALGLQKPAWLPDFGVAKRRAVLERFFGGGIDRGQYSAQLDGAFKMTEASEASGGGSSSSSLFKADFIEQMSAVGRSIPDFAWGASTDGRVDRDGYAIVAVDVSGHHTGAALELPGLPPLPASGQRVSLTALIKIKVEDGRIREFVVLPGHGVGPHALYHALSRRSSSQVQNV